MDHPKLDFHSQCIIRRATRKDAEVIGDLWVELMTFHAGLDARFAPPPSGRLNYIRHIHNAMRDDNYRLFVAEHQGGLVGYALGYIAQNPPIFPHPRFGFIADLCVTQSNRRKGVGRALVNELLNWFRGRKLDTIQLNVAYHNPISQGFWRNIGCTDYISHMWLDISPPLQDG